MRAKVARVARGAMKDMRWPEAVTLKVTERLQGPPRGMLTFVHSYAFQSDIFGAWKAAGREHLYVLVRNEQYREGRTALDDLDARYPLSLERVVRLGPVVQAETNYGPSGQGPWHLPLFTLDLKVVGEPEAILKATRAAVAEWRGRGRPEMHRLDVPGVVMNQTGEAGDVNALYLPVDRHLEDLARRIIRAPADYIKTSDFQPPKDEAARKNYEVWLGYSRDLLRAAAVKALGHFKSDENIALLKPLLDDPAFSGITHFEGGQPIDLGREYYIRKATYEVLREWGVAVKEPVIREKPAQSGPVGRRLPAEPARRTDRAAARSFGSGKRFLGLTAAYTRAFGAGFISRLKSITPVR